MVEAWQCRATNATDGSCGEERRRAKQGRGPRWKARLGDTQPTVPIAGAILWGAENGARHVRGVGHPASDRNDKFAGDAVVLVKRSVVDSSYDHNGKNAAKTNEPHQPN